MCLCSEYQTAERLNYSAFNQPDKRQKTANTAARLEIRAEGGLPWTLAGDTGGPLMRAIHGIMR